MENGQFPPETSGNPRGRPKGSKNQITILKQALELELRERASYRIRDVLDKAVELALEGNVTMIKLLLEMHMSRNQHAEDELDGKSKVQILVQNLTAKPANTVVSKSNGDVIDAEIVNDSKEK